MRHNLTRSIFILVAVAIGVQAQGQPGVIYNPAAGSALGASTWFQWYPSTVKTSQPNSYYVLMGTTGCFSNDVDSGDWVDGPGIGLISLDGQPPQGPILTVTVYYYSDPTDMSIRCTSFNANGPGASITSWVGQPTGLNSGDPLQLVSQTPTFNVKTNFYPYYVSVGTTGPGSTDIMNMVEADGPQFTITNPLPFTTGTFLFDNTVPARPPENCYITLYQQGVSKMFQYRNPTETPSGASNVDSEVASILPDDYTGAMTITPTTANPLRGDIVQSKHPGPHVFHADSQYAIEGGNYRYTYQVDTRKAVIISVGDPSHSTLANEHPSGWVKMGFQWVASMKPARAASLKFSLVTDWKPGLVEMIIKGPEDRGSGLTAGAELKFAIGPAFAPELDTAGVIKTIKEWVDNYGFKFLQPLVDDPSLDLNRLAPATDLEQQIVDCLRSVLQ